MAGGMRQVVEDVLNIEVNIILKAGMTGRKMPESHLALLDVIGDYDQYLGSGIAGNVVKKDAFSALATKAKEAAADDADAVIRRRIVRNCAAVVRILERPEVKAVVGAGITDGQAVHLPLQADEVLVVRKVWEVGTETIVIQTVAQLDGDIVTRLDRDRVPAAESPVHTVHRASVETAYQYWRFLIELAVDVTSRALLRRP